MWLQLLFKCKWCTVWYTRSPLAQGDCGDELTLPVAAEASPGLAEAKTELNSLEFARPWRRIIGSVREVCGCVKLQLWGCRGC
jgi:hypothetical protein